MKDDDQRRRDEAAFWVTVIDSGKMSEDQRLHFHAWLNVPRNARALSEIRTLVALIAELPEKKAAKLSRMPIYRTFFGGGARASSKVVPLPGHGLARAARFLLTPNAHKRYVEPVIADMQQEYVDAVTAGRTQRARWIAQRVYLLIIPGWLYAMVAGRLAALLRRSR
jgi:ferric-dicitrate binding protein FerR (iron transport regulator)